MKAALYFILALILALLCARIWQWEGDGLLRPEFNGSPMMEAKNYEYYTGH